MSAGIMNTETITVKIEPPDDYYDPGRSGMSSAVTQNGVTENGNVSSAANSSNIANHGESNFTCLLCDVICENREDLRKHLKTIHASKHHIAMATSGQQHRLSPEAAFTRFSSYMNYRYTCSTCGAKFKTFRTYLNHTMSHRGNNSLQSQIDDARMVSILSSGKQYLQDYIESDDGYPGTFTCDECKTDFMQRDAYAMHMMMRAMNETCQSVVVHQMKVEPTDVTGDSNDNVDEQRPEVSPINQTQPDIEPTKTHQRCLEDVTAKIDQDEYLRSVLDKVVVTEGTKLNNFIIHPSEERKPCAFCGESFLDQDSLAMHVMSDHAAQMTSGSHKRKEARGLKMKTSPWNLSQQSVVMNFNCKYCGELFLSRDSLAMHVLTHAHQGKSSDLHSGGANSYKRALESDMALSSSPRAKLLRTIGRFNQISLKQKLLDEQKQYGAKTDDTNLFCSSCNITFYALSEYEWHQRRHLEKKIITETEPLCLVKPCVKKTERVGNDDTGVKPTALFKQRRNSFSFDENSRNRDAAPKRPLSVGDCPSVIENDRPMSVMEDYKSRTTYSNSSTTSSPDISASLPSVNALSSNEQRIIYSVFGKDLSLPKDSKKENKTLTAPEINTVNEKDKYRVQNVPTDLTIANTRVSSIVTSGYKNGDQDGHQKAFKTDKETPMCKYCDILFLNKAIYYLHMGLHNVNNPWQCNVCGKICSDAVDFAAHVIHM